MSSFNEISTDQLGYMYCKVVREGGFPLPATTPTTTYTFFPSSDIASWAERCSIERNPE